MNIGDNMFYIWIGIVIFLTLIEIMTVNLTTIWYVISAIVALILTNFTDSYMIQVGTFAILGTILLLLTKPFIKKFLKKKKVPTNLDRILGMKGTVTEDILKNKTGEVKVDGKKWTAYADTELKKDTLIRVLEQNSVKLKVEKVEE